MAGKSWQLRHEPPHGRVERHPPHWLNRGMEGGEATSLKTSSHTKCSLSTRGILMHAHIKTPLTTKGMQALCVVNSIKLHLTAFNAFCFVFRTTIDHNQFRPIVHIAPIPRQESKTVHLVAITQSGK